MILTRQDLARIGRCLYGEHWRAPMAERLGKSKRTIERYATGDRNIPKRLAAQIEELIDQQIDALNALGGRQNATKFAHEARKSP